MTNETWKTLAAAVKSLKNPPAWLEKVSLLSHAEISYLPKLDNTRKGYAAAPSVREIILKEDYLDFLRQQIQLNTRGPEWTAVLQDRLNALQPFVSKRVLIADFYLKPSSATLYINPETRELFHMETFD